MQQRAVTAGAVMAVPGPLGAIALTGSNVIPACYLMAGGVVGLLGTLPLRR
jgi:hypothetical protein